MANEISFGDKTIKTATLDPDTVAGLGISDAPSDGNKYVRINGAWQSLSAPAQMQIKRGTQEERLQITPAEGEPIYDTQTKKLYVGDGSTAGGVLANNSVTPRIQQQNPPGMIKGISALSSGNLAFIARSTTGYVAVMWWDGSVSTAGTGAAGSNISFSKAVPASGAYSLSSPKTFYVWSCVGSSDAAKSGEMTRFSTYSNQGIVELYVNNLSGLLWLSVVGPLPTSSVPAANTTYIGLSSLDLSGVTGLTTLELSGQTITTLDLSEQANLTSISLSGCAYLSDLVLPVSASIYTFSANHSNLNSLNLSATNSLATLGSLNIRNSKLTSLNVSGFTGLSYLDARDNLLTSLGVSGCTALLTIYAQNNQLTSVVLSGCTDLRGVDLGGNQLTSVRAVGVGLWGSSQSTYFGYTGYPYGANLINNQLDAAALNQFYTDIIDTPFMAGVLFVSGNPGTTGDNPGIATAKGYTVYG